MTNSTPNPADALIAALHEPGREHLLDLVRNPLRLTLLCMTWDGSSLPETQAELYDRYLRKIYGWNQNWHELENHAQRCGTTTTKLKQNLNQQLGKLAKAALNLPQERFRLSQALVEEHLGEELDRTSLAYLALRLGWLNRVGRDGRGDGIFAFYHATFQEYFAALAVEDWDYFLPKDHVDRPVAGKQYRIFEKQWKQVILLWLGREDVEAEVKEAFIENLVNFDDGCGDWSPIPGIDKSFYGFQAYFLAATCSSEFKIDGCQRFQEIIDTVLNWSFGSYSTLDIISESATNALINANKKLFIPELIDCIKDSCSNSQKSKVSLFLEELGVLDREYLEKIEKILEQKSVDEYTQSTIMGLLEKVGDRKSINCLINQFSSTTDDLMKRLIAESILGIDSQNCLAKNVLIEIINNSSDELAKLLSIVALEKFQTNTKLSFEALKKLILDSSDEKIRSRAILNLKSFQYSQYVSPNSIDEIITKFQTEKEKSKIYIIAVNSGLVYPDTNKLLEIFIKSSSQKKGFSLFREQAFNLMCQQKDIIDYTEIIESTIKHCL